MVNKVLNKTPSKTNAFPSDVERTVGVYLFYINSMGTVSTFMCTWLRQTGLTLCPDYSAFDTSILQKFRKSFYYYY